ncbi:hypothetical protein [Bordetella bronchiseptica]|uniref:hypothetical protein n=1 Tax=Bordetella bronchiseptica TaxID=518 RepID=UPI0012D31041|nr:hypothetical protein [Bordetella bronchiseptica]
MFMEVSSGRRLRELLYGHGPCGPVPVRAALRAVDRLHPVEISIWHCPRTRNGGQRISAYLSHTEILAPARIWYANASRAPS